MLMAERGAGLGDGPRDLILTALGVLAVAVIGVVLWVLVVPEERVSATETEVAANIAGEWRGKLVLHGSHWDLSIAIDGIEDGRLSGHGRVPGIGCEELIVSGHLAYPDIRLTGVHTDPHDGGRFVCFNPRYMRLEMTRDADGVFHMTGSWRSNVGVPGDINLTRISGM